LQAWKAKAQELRNKRLDDFFARLARAKPQHENFIEDHFSKTQAKIQTASNFRMSKSRHSHKNSNIQAVLEKSKKLEEENKIKLTQKYKKRLESAELAINRSKSYQKSELFFNTLLLNKKILKSRIAKIMRNESSKLCDHYMKNAERISMMEFRQTLKKPIKNKSMLLTTKKERAQTASSFDLQKSMVERTEKCIEPDEVLLRHFSKEELKQVF